MTRWHAVIGDPNQADAICDRLLHDAHRIELKGRSMRRKHAAAGQRSAGDDMSTRPTTPQRARIRTITPPAHAKAAAGPSGPVDRDRAWKTRARHSAELERRRGEVHRRHRSRPTSRVPLRVLLLPAATRGLRGVMPDSLSEKVLARIDGAEALYHRLIVVCRPEWVR